MSFLYGYLYWDGFSGGVHPKKSSSPQEKFKNMVFISDDLQIREVRERSYISRRSTAAKLLIGRLYIHIMYIYIYT